MDTQDDSKREIDFLVDSEYLNKTKNQLRIRQIKKIGIRTICIIILLTGVYLVGKYYYPYSQNDLEAESNISLTLNDNQKNIVFVGDNFSNIQSLTIKDISKINLTTQKFPHLKELTLQDPYINTLKIDSNLKLDVLIIKNTNLTSFSYNSSQIKTLVLISNPLLIEFSNSSLLQMTNLTIINTNIRIWNNNKFGNITNVTIMNQQKLFQPQINGNISSMTIDNCTLAQKLTFYNKIKNLNLYRVKNLYIQVSKSDEIESIFCVETIISQLILSNCPNLKSLIVKNSSLDIIEIINAEKLQQFNVDYRSLRYLQLQQTNISSLKGDTESKEGIRRFYIKQTPLVALTFDYFPSTQNIQILSIDYSKVIDKTSFNLNLLRIHGLLVANYSNSLSFNQDNYPFLNQIHLINCSLPIFNARSRFIQILHLQNIVLQSQNQLPLENVSQLKQLYVQNVNIKYFNNIFLNLTKLTIKDCIQLQYIQNCSLTQFSLTNCPNLKSISYINISKTGFLSFACTLCSFDNNNLFDVYFVIINGLKNISNNSFPVLQTLNIKKCPDLIFSSLLSQLQIMKEQKVTTFRQLSVPAYVTNDQKQQIFKIFPNILIN